MFLAASTIATDYSSMWDINIGEWTQQAIDKGYCSRITEEFAVLGFVEQGWVTGPGEHHMVNLA